MSASSGQVQACAGSLNVAGTITASSVTGNRYAVNTFVGTVAAPIVIAPGVNYTFPNASTSSGFFKTLMEPPGAPNFVNLLVAPGTPFSPVNSFAFVTVSSPILFLFDITVQPSAIGWGLSFITPVGAIGDISFAFSHL